MPGEVRFYTLCRRFVDEQVPAPEVRQLKYYTLAIGHHVGVVDCFTPVLVIGEPDYFQWIRKLPDGPARKKLEGLARWGELEINRDHVAPLVSAVSEAASAFGPEEAEWAGQLLHLLRSMEEEPAIYLVVRRSAGVSDFDRERTDGR